MDLLHALRPHQWTKNLLVFAGLIFAQRLFDPWALQRSVAAFLLFCAASSAVYLFNDVADRERDRLHPHKRERAIASGRVSVPAALTVAALLAILAVTGAAALGPTELTWLFVAYLVMQLAYTSALKNVAIVDALIVAVGFVMRAVAGALAIDVRISTWLLICTTFFALFVSLAKRRHELVDLPEGSSHRISLVGYDAALLDQLIAITTAACLMAYALYTADPETAAHLGTPLMPVTLPFVIYAFFRFLYIARTRDDISDPALSVVRDRGMLVAVLLWGLVTCAIVYLL